MGQLLERLKRGHPILGHLDVFFVGVYHQVAAGRFNCRNSGTAGAAERIKHHIALERIELDAASGKLHGERRRMANLLGALRPELPYAFGALKELILRYGGVAPSPPKAALVEDQYVFMGVPQRRV